MTTVVAEESAAAQAAGLVYVSDAGPGITRERRGKDFVYRDAKGKRLTDEAQIARIRKLAIPPAYEKVWICPSPRGHLQATGRDARGRKQYRYHPQWREARDATKFERMAEFAAVLPKIRAQVQRHLALPVGERILRDAVLATIVRLLDTTLVRIGNDEYARENNSFGLTTLRNRHAAVQGSTLKLRFRGKSGVMHDVQVEDPRIAKIVRRSQALPGQELFQYVDDAGEAHTVGSADVNEYLRACSGAEISAKDFRTWHASVHAFALARRELAEATAAAAVTAAAAQTAEALARVQQAAVGKPTKAALQQRVQRILGEVAGRLGNTIAVCRKAYVHPGVLAVLTGEDDLCEELPTPRKTGLTKPEREFCGFLAHQQRAAKRALRAAAKAAVPADRRTARTKTPAPAPRGAVRTQAPAPAHPRPASARRAASKARPSPGPAPRAKASRMEAVA